MTLKGSYMFRCENHHPQGARYVGLAKVTIVKMSYTPRRMNHVNVL